jgi:hypothetical protein
MVYILLFFELMWEFLTLSLNMVTCFNSVVLRYILTLMY